MNTVEMEEPQVQAQQDATATDIEVAGERLAQAHQAAGPYRRGAGIASAALSARLPKLAQSLSDAASRLQAGTERSGYLSPAAEWMIDNTYIAEQALHGVQKDFPADFERQLPRLPGGGLRVYAIAEQALALNGDRVLDVDHTRRFVMGYQARQPLAIGEIWALPIMLRLILLGNLLAEAAQLSPPPPELAARDEAVLAVLGVQPGRISLENCIRSLRLMAAQDWKRYVEDLSLVEAALRQDPAGIYPATDFETRDRCRKVVEELAQASERTELEVAQAALGMARGQAADPALPGSPVFDSPRAAHVGYYLIAEGRRQLEKAVKYRPRGRERVLRAIRRRPLPAYVAVVAGLAALLVGGGLAYAAGAGASAGGLLLVTLLSVVPAVTVAVELVNWLVTRLFKPVRLPRLDFSEGISAHCAALVAVPAILASPEDVRSLVRQLELHFLRNPDPRLRFALVTDFADAPAETLPTDAGLVRMAQHAIQALNEAHAPGEPVSFTGERFLLLHRARRWNPQEGVWMGWERKRGKLHELNQLILSRQGKAPGGAAEAFPWQAGGLQALDDVRYVITLDADTILPAQAARELVSTLAHPLNRAVVQPQAVQAPSEACGARVRAGYSVLQPRTEINPVSSRRSLFTRIYAGVSGLDLYSHAVSDVYQDLFGEGSYIGKGIYDVAAFEHSLEGCIPENTVLSHDLLEGLHGRAALETHIVLIEDISPNYLGYAHRLHRWIRGDWQLLRWLFAGRLSGLGRWKILDNLRRSLAAPALLALLVASWLALPGSPGFWTTAAVLVLAAPSMTGLVVALHRRLARRPHWQAQASLGNQALRWLLALVFLPFEAALAIDAILRTLVRVTITRRGLLNWVTSVQAARSAGAQLARNTWRQMAFSPAAALLVSAAVALSRPAALPWALPFCAAWLLAPAVAVHLSKPVLPEKEELDQEQETALRRLARRTWLFFDQFTGPEDHWLPPDHFQEAPLGVTAHRTSPTNIGLGLLAVLGAYDLGYVGVLGLTSRLSAALDTLEKLARYRGHFLNWYDTLNLEPLPPRYVSTVDSGNLAACLLALRQGCLEIGGNPVLRRESFEGLVDALALLKEELAGLAPQARDAQIAAVEARLDAIVQAVRAAAGQPTGWSALFDSLPGGRAGGEEASRWPALEKSLLALIEAGGPALDAERLRRLRAAYQAARRQLSNLRRSLAHYLPWLALLHNPPAFFTGEGLLLQPVLETLRAHLPPDIRLTDIPAACRSALGTYAGLGEVLSNQRSPEAAAARRWLEQLRGALETSRAHAESSLQTLSQLAVSMDQLYATMDFSFLFDRQRQIFHIGYNLQTGSPDPNYYDLLASEARLASLAAMAKGDTPHSHWLHLSRPFTRVAGRQALVSWSATMFEYLMPRLLMRTEPDTLLAQTLDAVVERQIAYGREKGVPWGISESGYYRFDANQFYQYRAFGVPGLGFKRGLGDDLVITPHASLLALPLRPRAVVQNMARLESLGMLGLYGFYEAIDFTPARLSLGQEAALVRSYMSHHQGMILLSLVNHLHGDVMVRRFHRDPRVQSMELLLLEQAPRDVPLEEAAALDTPAVRVVRPRRHVMPWRADTLLPQPRVHYLSNGRLGTLVTGAGGGYLAWQGLQLTRWRADPTLDDWGVWVYVQDVESGETWSASAQPVMHTGGERQAFFSSHLAEYHRRDQQLTQALRVFICPAEDVEVRLATFTNQGDQPRRLRVTSYGEVSLAPPGADARHPAFNKMFIESRVLPGEDGLVFRRRPRAAGEEEVFLVHTLRVEGDAGQPAPPQLENDRARFLGRGRTARRPAALEGTWPTGLQDTLDPIFSISQEIEVAAHSTAHVAFLTAAGRSADGAMGQVERYPDHETLQRALEQAREQAEAEVNQLEITTPQLENFQTLLSLLVFPSPALRPAPERLAQNVLGQPGLWPFGISGDYPILLVKLAGEEDLSLAGELLKAHAYWRRRGLLIDLVFLNLEDTSYQPALGGHFQRLLHGARSEAWLNRRGGIFLVHADHIDDASRTLLESAARVVLEAGSSGLAERLESTPALQSAPARLPPLFPTLSAGRDPQPTEPLPRPIGLRVDNGLGGFSAGGREYVIYLEPGQFTPAPWVHVVANPDFGFLAAESGLGFSWSENSGENRLSPWTNDPVSNMPGEALYLRDEETAVIWSPTPLPAPSGEPTLVRYGAGYVVYETRSHGLHQEMRVFTPPDSPVKIVELRLRNTWDRSRRVTATYYVEWVLGVLRESSGPYLVPEFTPDPQALLVRNPYNTEFGRRVAFAAASNPLHGMTTDRAEFLGELGSLQQPAALGRVGLEGTVRPGLDLCAALQLHIDMQPGAAEQVHFVLGQADSPEEALALVRHYREQGQVKAAWEKTAAFWDDLLGAVQVETPDPSFDLLLNRWLLYQDLACRIWARSGFYQSSGAYGFRDQLQDVMALLWSAPEEARAHLLRAARRQFEQGDVLHWWHPPSGRGVRTRISDDLLWLPYVTAEYVSFTGDVGVLEEEAPFLSAPPLAPGEEERYGAYAAAPGRHTLFEHCRRALERGLTSGPHGLPLIGGGDWNDGMNRVGIEGRGESVWLAWFLVETLRRFARLCTARRLPDLADRYRQQAAALAEVVEAHAWDGAWYLRAFYDDGHPLGSASNEECQIDSIAQSWAVLSGAGSPARQVAALDALWERLVHRDWRLVLLFTPPFSRTRRDPGYIRGYPPGVRENGGQYTHAALWAAWAFLEAGRIEEGYEMFQLINPILQADTLEKAREYQVEPYVVAADVYSVPPFVRRGGWTWYTGSGGWMYRLGLEGILGMRREGDALLLNPRVPRAWPGFRVVCRQGQGVYHIEVQNPDGVNHGVQAAWLDGASLPIEAGDHPVARIPLTAGGVHTVRVLLG